MTDTNSFENSVVIERSFDAPVELIWQMWTVPEHFAAWYGPNGATIPAADMEVRVGGRRLVGMDVQTPGGRMAMWFTGQFLEVVEHKRLVFTEAICDENGNIVEGPDGHPTMTEVRVQLEDLGERTNMVLTHIGIPEGSPGAAGWAMAFDKLAAYVRSGAER
jgi:uncharacterized protein YndB with AHSA1/START domain